MTPIPRSGKTPFPLYVFAALLAFVMLGVSLPAAATVYKCVNANVGVTYSDIPCSHDAKKLTGGLSSSSNGYIKTNYVANSGSGAATGGQKPGSNSPVLPDPEEFQRFKREIPAAVGLAPGRFQQPGAVARSMRN
jgi:hypothetical protein